jgi:DNA-binding XRE family transcriptional regulator
VSGRQNYEDLVDARDHAAAMERIRHEGAETLTETELDDYVAAATPLAFWRKRRGLTQAVLAGTVGVSQGYLAQIESGRRVGDVQVYARLARRLSLRMEDLVVEEAAEPRT